MKLFLVRLFKFILPLILVLSATIVIYLAYDPFMVVYKYKSYYKSGEPSYITLNRDYVSMETFINNYPEYKYNSFIFGNSRTRFYEMSTWSKLIHTDQCFHFDASGESLYGIHKKMEFLDQQHITISNALVVLDYGTLRETQNSKGHLFIKHPILSGQNNFAFQIEFFKAFCSYNFLPAFLDFKFSGHIKEYMVKSNLLDDVPMDYDLKYNEMSFPLRETSIKADPTVYYNSTKMKRFFLRDSIEKSSPPVIKKAQLDLLHAINEIFQKDKTHFKIIISPTYDQLKLNKEDLEQLKKIFGEETVFDFSGKNAFTADYHNYYEESHYRPVLANEIMKIVENSDN